MYVRFVHVPLPLEAFQEPLLVRAPCTILPVPATLPALVSARVSQTPTLRCAYMLNLRMDHMQAVKRVIRYLKGILDLGLYLNSSTISSLVSYTDVEWGGCLDIRPSTSGYCVFLGDNLVLWFSKRQSILSQSNVEVEYKGVANVVSESCWL
ncbi:uncharacterized mitochondrial protein AtMg00810-like [Vigna angularis]|uniref:uncharacterized mitochondrial protein AtMg00810-like n=1 Tax=Phaseolus angularis TaxID=3914 RepID=UPI00080A752C|nr:uncharacterized mitochondrial protein AtMg00810-like [Vigna angularis]